MVPLSVTEQVYLAERRKPHRGVHRQATPQDAPKIDVDHPLVQKLEQLALRGNVLMFPKQFKFLRDCQKFMVAYKELFGNDNKVAEGQ